MQETERKLSALAYALGWTAAIVLAWVILAYALYLARVSGCWPLPAAWFPAPEVHLIFIGVAKLMGLAFAMGWIAVLLYRRRYRALT